MQYAICNELFEGWDLERVFRFVSELGYESVELAPFTLAKSIDELSVERRRDIARSAAAHGLAIAGMHWLLVGPSGLQINHPDPTVRARTTAYLEELIRACADLGGKVLVFGSPKQRWVPPEVDYGEATRYARDVFAACARVAEAAGVTFCLEALPAPEANFLTTTAEAIELVRAIDSPALRMILDVKSMASEPVEMPDLIRQAAPYLAHFHANDANRRGPGAGDVDFVPVFQTLREVGYRGYVSVEVFDFSQGPEAIARESLAYMRRCEEVGDKRTRVGK